MIQNAHLYFCYIGMVLYLQKYDKMNIDFLSLWSHICKQILFSEKIMDFVKKTQIFLTKAFFKKIKTSSFAKIYLEKTDVFVFLKKSSIFQIWVFFTPKNGEILTFWHNLAERERMQKETYANTMNNFALIYSSNAYLNYFKE